MMDEPLKLVMLRNAFYRDNYRKAVIVLLLLLLVNVGMVIAALFDLTHPPQPQYFPMTPDGRMIKLHALSDPVFSDDFVMQWAANAATKFYALDFVHWREELQRSSDNFTPDGWRKLLAQLKGSNNLRTVEKFHMVVSAQVTGAPVLAAKSVIGGRYVWKITLPLYITFTNGQKVIHQTAKVLLLVVRMSVADNPHRIAINNMIVNLRGR